jgi:hypothetical protein
MPSNNSSEGVRIFVSTHADAPCQHALSTKSLNMKLPADTVSFDAIFDATGGRVREILFTPDRVKAALAARA